MGDSSGHPATALSIVSLSSPRDANAALRMTSTATTPSTRTGSPSELILGQSAGLVGTQHIHAGQLFDRHKTADDSLRRASGGLRPPSSPRAHGRHRYRDGGHRQDQRELKCRQHWIATEHGDRRSALPASRPARLDSCRSQHGALEMADRVGCSHQLRCLAEIVYAARTGDDRVGFSLANDRSRKTLPRLFYA